MMSLSKSKSKRPSKKALKKKLWELCRLIVRKQYGTDCYTCPAKNLEGSNLHTAHFIPSSTCGLFLRYDLRNLRPCCYRCNVNLGGNGAAYYRNMVAREGQAYVDGIFADKNRITKESIIWYEEKIGEYQKLIDLMS